jgi:hypothetical protein
MRILISYEDSYHLYSEALERAFSALLSSIHLSARKWNSRKLALLYLVILSKPADSGKEKTWLRNSYPTSCGKR